MKKLLVWKYNGLDEIHSAEYDESDCGTHIQLPNNENMFSLKVSSGSLVVLDCLGVDMEYINIEAI